MSNELVLKIEIYPAATVIEAALIDSEPDSDYLEVTPASMTKIDWDNLVDRILQAEKIVCI